MRARCEGFIFLAGANLAAPWSEISYCSDACPSGYALHEARLRAGLVVDLAAVREHWRFDDVEPAFLDGRPLRDQGSRSFVPGLSSAALLPELRTASSPQPRHISVTVVRGDPRFSQQRGPSNLCPTRRSSSPRGNSLCAALFSFPNRSSS